MINDKPHQFPILCYGHIDLYSHDVWIALFPPDHSEARYFMAKKRGKTAEFAFVRYHLTKDDKAAMKEWFSSDPNWYKSLIGAVFAGHKFSLAWSDENDTYYAALTCVNDASPNKLKVLTSRHEDPTKAQAQLVWLITQYLPEIWPTEIDEEDESW